MRVASPEMLRAASRLLVEASRTQVRAARDQAAAPVESRLEKAISRVFGAQGREFLRILPANGGLDTWSDSLSEVADRYRGDFVAPVRTGLATSMIAGSNLTLVGMGELAESFNLANPRAQWWLANHSSELVKGMDKESRARIRSIVTTSRARGDSYANITKALRTEFGDMGAKRARIIAVTETAFGYEQGSRMAAETLVAAGLQVQKSFLAERGACELCIANQSAGWLPLDQEYPNGEAPVHPSCRCTSIYQTVRSR